MRQLRVVEGTPAEKHDELSAAVERISEIVAQAADPDTDEAVEMIACFDKLIDNMRWLVHARDLDGPLRAMREAAARLLEIQQRRRDSRTMN